jgi:hypothetical protein
MSVQFVRRKLEKGKDETMSTRTNSVRLLVALVISATPLALFAASPHYKHDGTPVCSPPSDSVTGTTFSGGCTAGLATGLGNGDLTFGVIATGSSGTFCHNKGNPANIVPGQNPAEAQFASLQTIPGSAIKNGNATLPAITFSFSLGIPTPEEAGCPNDNNWTVSLGPATWTAQYVVYQPFPTNLLVDLSFSF